MADDFLQQVNRTFNEVKDKITPNRSLMTAIAGHMLTSVQMNFENQGEDVMPGGWPKRFFPGRKSLESRITRSLQAKATDNEAMVGTNTIGASLFHYGGEVKAKKILGSVKRKRDVWAMEQYFWSQWYKSRKKEKRWMILALHMQHNNSITVPARPYMVLTETFKNMIIQEIREYAFKIKNPL